MDARNLILDDAAHWKARCPPVAIPYMQKHRHMLCAVLISALPSGEVAGWRGCREGRSQQKGLSATEEACGSSYFAIGSDIGLSAKVNLSHMMDLTFAVIKSIIIQ